MDIIATAHYFILGVVICYIGQIFDWYLKRSKRQQIILSERKLYYQKLVAESLTMEEEKSKIEADLIENIDQAKRENGEIEEQLDDDVDSEWSSNGQEELDELKQRVDELRSVEESISEQSIPSEDCKVEILNEKIAQLEEDNRKLREQIDNHDGDSLVTGKDTEFDPELLNFLNSHKEISLDFLQQAYKLLLEMKVSEPDKDFNVYVEELRTSRVEYANRLAELRVAKRAAEHKLEIAKKKYLEELRLFNESRTDYMLKQSVRQDYLTKLKESNQVREDIIKNLEDELERLKSEIGMWREKFHAAEQQAIHYHKACQESLIKKDQLEAERARVVSATSSFVDHHIPPPPNPKIPSVDELLQSS